MIAPTARRRLAGALSVHLIERLKQMEEEYRDKESSYVEFGVESVAPDDDFAYWTTRKRFEEERRRFIANACGGCADCCER